MNVLQFLEYSLLKEFNASLSEEERKLLKEYMGKLVVPSSVSRQYWNQMAMIYIDGMKMGKKIMYNEIHGQTNNTEIPKKD